MLNKLDSSLVKKENRTQQTISLTNRIIETQSDLIWLLEESGGVNLGTGGISSGLNLETKILELITKNEWLNTKKTAEILKISLRTTQIHSKKLKDERKIKFKGARKNFIF